MCAAFGAGVAGMIYAESLRLSLVPPFGARIHGFLSSFIDERDSGFIILSHIYLLLGCASSVWINASRLSPLLPSSSFQHFPPFAGVLVLGIADSMVSFFPFSANNLFFSFLILLKSISFSLS